MSSREEMYRVIYERLAKKFPEKPWLESISRLGSNASINKLGESLISYGLWLYELKPLNELDEYEKGAVAEAIFYSAKIMEFYEALALDKKGSFEGRWGAAFSTSNDMRALVFETYVFYALESYGWQVEYKDDDASGETYDYLISKGDVAVQIECKSFAYDKGLIISTGDAKKLISRILKSWQVTNKAPENELCVVTVEICEKLPENPGALDRLAAEICEIISDGADGNSEKFNVKIQHFSEVTDIHSEIKSILPIKSDDVELLCVLSEPKGKSSRTCLRVTTTASNAFWREFENVCKEAAKRQLKKNKPAILAVHISNIESLKKILSDHRFVSKKNNIFNQPHLVGLALISNICIYEQEKYPFVFLRPLTKEFSNERTVFDKVGKIFN